MNVFARYEQKYRVDREALAGFTGQLETWMRADDHGLSRVSSLYLDTSDQVLTSRSMERPSYKEKLRLRVYQDVDAVSEPGDSPTAFLETKKKLDGKVYKRRVQITQSEARNLIEHGIIPASGPTADRQQRQIIRELAYSLAHYGDLEPYLWVSCLRRSFAECEASAESLRITCDTDLRWQTGSWQPNAQSWQPLLADGEAVIEIKCHSALPLWLAQLLDRMQIYPQSFSKIATAHVLKGPVPRLPVPKTKEEEQTWTNSSNHSWQALRAAHRLRQQNSLSALPYRLPSAWSAHSSIGTEVPTTKVS